MKARQADKHFYILNFAHLRKVENADRCLQVQAEVLF